MCFFIEKGCGWGRQDRAWIRFVVALIDPRCGARGVGLVLINWFGALVLGCKFDSEKWVWSWA